MGPELVCLLRISPDATDHVVCLHNISDRTVSIEKVQLPDQVLPTPRNLVNGKFIANDSILIEPYQTLWLASE
jgi:hypothetical protein